MLTIKNCSFAYGATPVLSAVDLEIKAGECFALLGPSGCGKSTLLKLIAGFMAAQGSIKLDGQELVYGCDLVESRDIGFVFQDGALFPHITVQANMAYGIQHYSKREQQDKIKKMAEHLELSAILNRYPHEISGGQQQRVAIARALVREPKCLLMDEPFSSLDTKIKQRLHVEIRDLLKSLSITTLLVTHDQQEAFSMADRVGVMMHGSLLQEGTPEQIYMKPEHLEVANFVGKGSLVSFKSHPHLRLNPQGTLFIRPEWVVMCSDDDADLQAFVVRYTHMGAYVDVDLELRGEQQEKQILNVHLSPHDLDRAKTCHTWRLIQEPICFSP